MTRVEAMARVNRGVAWMDRQHPGWAHLVDVTNLDLGCTKGCVMGQVYGDFNDAMDEFFTDYQDVRCVLDLEFSVAQWLGFDISEHDDDEEYAVLQDCWVEVIAQRICSNQRQDAPILLDV